MLCLLTGCATKVEESKRLGNLNSTPNGITYIWSSSETTTFSNLPALGAVSLMTPSATFWRNLPSDYALFGASLKSQLPAKSSPGTSSVVVIPMNQSQKDLVAEIEQAKPDSAVIVMFPARVTSYCQGGCYAFKIRVNYLSPGSREIVWTGLIDLPPKNQFDPMDPLVLEFTAALTKQLQTEKLIPQ
jgi:hypothetical protein